MKQTQNTHVYACSLAGEGAAAYSLVRRVAAAVTGKSGEAAAYSLAREGRRRQSLGLGVKTPKPLLSAKQKQQPSDGLASSDSMRAARAQKIT